MKALKALERFYSTKYIKNKFKYNAIMLSGYMVIWFIIAIFINKLILSESIIFLTELNFKLIDINPLYKENVGLSFCVLSFLSLPFSIPACYGYWKLSPKNKTMTIEKIIIVLFNLLLVLPLFLTGLILINYSISNNQAIKMALNINWAASIIMMFSWCLIPILFSNKKRSIISDNIEEKLRKKSDKKYQKYIKDQNYLNTQLSTEIPIKVYKKSRI